MEEKYRVDKPLIRHILKLQMQEQKDSKLKEFWIKSQESEVSISYDNDCIRKDHEARIKKKLYLQNFRDVNKELMERKRTERRNDKFLEDRLDRERLKLEPINWRHTLH